MGALYFFITALLLYIVLRAGLGIIDRLLRKLPDDWQMILNGIRWPAYGVIIVFSGQMCTKLPLFPADLRTTGLTDLFRLALTIALIWLGVRTVTMCLFSLYFYKVRGILVPQVLPWIGNKFLYVAAFIGYLHIVYAFSIGDLTVITAIILVVLSIAFQKPLGSFITDVSASLQKTFRYGDVVQLKDFQGEVVESSWRYLRLLDRHRDHVTIPIRQTLEFPITNFSHPDRPYRATLNITINDSLSPNRIRAILMRSLLETDDVLKTPPPGVSQKNAQPGYIHYTLAFSIQNYKDKERIGSAVRSIVWYKLRREGLVFPYGSDFEAERYARTQVTEEQYAEIANLIKRIEIFSVLSSAAVQKLAQQAHLNIYGKSERVCHQGDPGDSLFIIVEGVIGIWVQLEDGQSLEVTRRFGGDVIGEMALLTGEPRTATVIAAEETILCEITKENIAPFLEEQPEIVEHLSNILAERKLETALAKESAQSREEVKETLYKQFIHTIRGFFGLKRSDT